MQYEEYTKQKLDRSKVITSGYQEHVECPECDGHGEFYTSHKFDCSGCDGRGYIEYSIFLERIEINKTNQIEDELREDIENSLNRLKEEQLKKIKSFIKEKL
jgi:RecJ-like exonuclease